MMDDLSQHGVIIELRWEIHPIQPNGRYTGAASDTNKSPLVVEVKCPDRTLALAKIKEIINNLRTYQNADN